MLELSKKDAIKMLARNKDSKVQKHFSYIEQRLGTIQNMKYEVQEMMIVDNVEDAIVDEWVSFTNEKIEQYQELVDQLKRCLEDLREKKEEEIRKKEYEMQGRSKNLKEAPQNFMKILNIDDVTAHDVIQRN